MPHSRLRTLYDKTTVNLIDEFVEQEYLPFPVAEHDDMLDCLARIVDPRLMTRWPEEVFGEWGRSLRRCSATTNLDPAVHAIQLEREIDLATEFVRN
jgi:hypothetical protein